VTRRAAVLLVSTDADSAEMYAVGLGLAGFEPLVAADASSIRSCLSSGSPQAIVADFTAGWDSGWELLRDLRSRPDTRDTPVLLLASRMEASTWTRAEAVGCAAVLMKPCLPDALAAAVRSAIHAAPAVVTPDAGSFC
jgi:two-component system, chemotaxis family, chemotaxis protein CheY